MKDRLEALKHSANFDDDETQDFDEPSTVIDEENTFMDNFFQRVATIRGNIDKIAQDVEQVKEMHRQMLSAAVQDQEVKDELERLMYDVKRTANSVRTNLKEMEQRINQQDMDSSCNNYAESRIRRCQHSTLARKFVEVMSDCNTTQSDYREKCKSRIQRQLEITGKTKTSDEVEEMLEGRDPGIFTSDIVIETQQARQALGDIEARHRDIINLEKSIQVSFRGNFEGSKELYATMTDDPTRNSTSGRNQEREGEKELKKRKDKRATAERKRAKKEKAAKNS
ncbi:syntaxin-1A-like isoform X2 [Montipora capricornis]|uniref:syntaxin-1A-like isoform X2 n=1 Tax=Montipora capricornis TaxID=246305 RepID=UPI0035F1DD0E